MIDRGSHVTVIDSTIYTLYQVSLLSTSRSIDASSMGSNGLARRPAEDWVAKVCAANMQTECFSVSVIANYRGWSPHN